MTIQDKDGTDDKDDKTGEDTRHDKDCNIGQGKAKLTWMSRAARQCNVDKDANDGQSMQ